MAIDRTEARRRVRTITGWVAAGAAALTAGFAFGASRGDHVAQSSSPAPATTSTPPQDVAPQTTEPELPQDSGGGFGPPSASNEPPTGMSGGS
jgi:hypothetical protein